MRRQEHWEQRDAELGASVVQVDAHVHDNAIVLPPVAFTDEELAKPVLDETYKGGVVSPDFEFIAGRCRSQLKDHLNLNCQGAYEVPSDQLQQRDEDVVFAGVLYHHFGHTLVDTFARLWYLVEHPDFEKAVFVDCPFEFASDFDPFSLIDLMGFPREKFEIITHPTQFRSVTVPDEAFFPFSGWAPQFAEPFRLIRDHIEPANVEKLYFSRRAYQQADDGDLFKSQILNEEYYESFFERRGFEVVHPEQLPLREQIALVAGAKELVSTLGTMTHLLLFAQDGIKATILNRVECIVAQLLVDKACGVEPFYIDCACNPLKTQHARGPFLLLPNRCFKAYLDATNVEYEKDELDESAKIPTLVDGYLRMWAEVYREPELSVVAGRETMFDVIRRMNELYYDSPFDEDQYRAADIYRTRVAELKQAKRDNKQKIADQKAKIAEQAERIKELEDELSRIKNSKSWKLTKPFRK